MEEEKDVAQESSPEEVVEETPVVSEDVKTPESEPKTDKKEEKVVPFSRFKEVNDELSKLKKEPVKVVNKALDVEDYIDISASLEGLDAREKQYLAQQHKNTGKPLSEIRKDEDFGLWQTAYRAKVEKELQTLKPSGAQSESERPKTLEQQLAGATVAEKEEILTKIGMYKSPRPRQDRVNLGRGK